MLSDIDKRVDWLCSTLHYVYITCVDIRGTLYHTTVVSWDKSGVPKTWAGFGRQTILFLRCQFPAIQMDSVLKEKVEIEKTEERALCSGRRQHELKVDFNFTKGQGVLRSCLYLL